MINNSLFNIHGRLVRLSYPAVMGIVNLDANSFYKKSITSQELLESKVIELVGQGADIIDLGAMTSRPGSVIRDQQDELKILTNALEVVQSNLGGALLSIDTIHSATAERMIDLGVHFINDISGSEYDPRMKQVIADRNIPYVAMHMRGTPEVMQSEENTQYEDVVFDVVKYFSRKKRELLDAGIHQLIIDPGFGFSKTVDQNYQLLCHLNLFEVLDCPILVGISRKSMISKLLNTNSDGALAGTLAAQTLSLIKGANILRVHDVKEAKDIVKIFMKYKQQEAKI